MDNLTVFSVFEITRHLRQVIESSIAPLYVKGEIASFVHHSSGHMYFNLKDEYSTLRCTFFRPHNLKLDFTPQNGQSVICFGRLTLYEKGGSYNLNVTEMVSSGIGDMQMRFEALKKKLDSEGLFAQERKQALPKYPQKIGIITSPTGAALQDIMNILSRRYPIEVLVYPALVQGKDAPASMIRGLRYFQKTNDVDLLILTRGGGSQEDLFCFNDEALAREIAAAQIPLVSAVGHEIDFTISDFVADFRAPTPSAAAELAVPNRDDLLSYLQSIEQNMLLICSNRIGNMKHRLHEADVQLMSMHPSRILQEVRQRFDLASMALENVKHHLDEPKQMLAMAEQSLISSAGYQLSGIMDRHKDRLDRMTELMNHRIQRLLDQSKSSLRLMEQELEQYSPKTMQKRGWIIAVKNGNVVRSVKEIQQGDSLELSFCDGLTEVEVKEIK